MNEANLNKLELQDKILVCCDCGQEFTFEAGEQRYYRAKLLTPRKRCQACIAKRKQSLVPDGGGL